MIDDPEKAALRRSERGEAKPAVIGLSLLAAILLAVMLAPGSSRALPTPRHQGLLDFKAGSASLIRGSFQDAETQLGKALDSGALDYLEKAAALKNRGVARWRLKRLRAAIKDFNAAVKITPGDPTLYNNRGNALLSLGMNAEAMKDFTRAIQLSPNYAEAFNNRGNAHFKAGDYHAAFRDFRRAVELRPDMAEPFNGRGKAQLALGRRFGALRDFRRATTLDAAYAIAHANRAKALMALRRYDRAIEEDTFAIRLRPKSARFLLERGRAYARSGKPGEAVKDITAAIALNPTSATAFAERSEANQALGKDDEATADLRQALSLNPESPVALAYLAKSLADGGAPVAALPVVDEALRAAPKNALALRVRGQIREALNQIKLAVADYRAALRYDAFQPESRDALRRIAEASDSFQPKEVASPLDGWTISLSPTNRYVAENQDYPGLRVVLEMYGEGEPELLDWKMLKGPLRKTGMLSYYAGSAADGTRLEYAALIDTRGRKLVGIEPLRWGTRDAEWTWNNLAVVVEDPEGVPSRLELKGAPARSTLSSSRRRGASQDRGRSRVGPDSSGFLRWLFQ
jgi:tetratricopeptide (TPR) repeat protein